MEKRQNIWRRILLLFMWIESTSKVLSLKNKTAPESKNTPKPFFNAYA
jgi:hypothetical protein